MPLGKNDARKLVQRRHPEWVENQRRWRWLQDSLEGGNRYRHADYALDPTLLQPNGMPWYYNYGYDSTTSETIPFSYKQIVDRNLVPHLSEMGQDGRDVYALRLHRTPVPTNLARAIRSHLSRIYAHEVRRDGPATLQSWWEDVDGSGQKIDQWVRKTVAPLFLTLGQLDLVFDHPQVPAGATVRTRADQMALGLDKCVAGVILPENLVWWRPEPYSRRYAECLVFERDDAEGEGAAFYRHWTPERCDVYDPRGSLIAERSYDHPFGRVPVVRVFDTRRARSGNVGESRYEAIAELQKAIYNATSELILGDTEQSHAQLEGPEDFLQKTSEVPIGPGNILPKKKNTQGGSVSYEGWSYVEPPKGAQEAVRQHILDWTDAADREAELSKPAGMSSRGSVGQSGVSKLIDHIGINTLMAEISEALQSAEQTAAEFALTVLTDGTPTPADKDKIEIIYPKEFDLFSVQDLSEVIQDLLGISALAGFLPQTETELIQRLVSAVLPGIDDDRQQQLHDEIKTFVQSQTTAKQALAAAQQQQALAGPEWGGAALSEADQGAVTQLTGSPA